MRRGDCCLLPWKDVDLKQGFITVKMAKTGLAQKVTGHTTTETILKHYFQPGREAFRQALQSAMPKLLTNGQKSPKEEIQEILTGMTAKTLKKDKARLEKIIAAL